MTTHGASLRIFLPGGTPDGVRLVSKSNWTGLAVASSRSSYPEARSTREEFRTPGVYLLVGPPESAKYEARIYIGEGEDPQRRIDNHHAEKDFWNQVVLFTSSGAILNKATIRYIEARLVELAREAGRAELDNGTDPGHPSLAEADRHDAESFLADMLIIYPVLGLNFFERKERPGKSERLHLSGPSAFGEGAETKAGFIVYAGATARGTTVESIPSWALSLRAGLIDDGALLPSQVETFELQEDYEFRSPSAAAAVLLGRSAAGPLEWKTKSGTPLRQLRADSVE